MVQNNPSAQARSARENKAISDEDYALPLQQNRGLPQNIDAEKSVLAACMLDGDAMIEIAYILKPQNFYRLAHRTIFEAMLDMSNRHVGVDQLSLADNLNGKGLLEQVGGRAYLVELAQNTLSLVNWKTHAEIVKRLAVMREMVKASLDIAASAYDSEDDLVKVVGWAEDRLFKATEQGVSTDFKPIHSLLNDTITEIQNRVSQRGAVVGAASGFRDVDNLFHGFRPGDLIILAARPAVGKTAFALNMAVNAAKAGAKVAFLSLEMSASQLVQRVLCSEARVNMSKIGAGTLDDQDWTHIVQASGDLSMLDLLIDDTPELTINQMRAKARRQLRGVENGIIFVDYLQLMTPAVVRKDGNRAVEVGEMSRGLKILAKELGVPVVALSQLSRDIEKRGAKNKEPVLSDLRESGSIEQDADIVMFLDRSTSEEEAENDLRPDLGMARLIVAKHRNGSTGRIDLTFTPEYTRFGDAIDLQRYGDIVQ